jgi:transposase
MHISILGVDLGKNVCSVVGLDRSGAVVLRRRARRETLIELTAKLPACVVAMEACCGAHHLGRIFAGQGHEVRLMSPEYVRPTSSRRRTTTGMRKESQKRRHGRQCDSST